MLGEETPGILGLAFATGLLVAPTRASAEKIYKWVDADGVIHLTNIKQGAKRQGRTDSGGGSHLQADPSFKNYQPGPDAPLDFVPHDNTSKFDSFIKEDLAHVKQVAAEQGWLVK